MRTRFTATMCFVLALNSALATSTIVGSCLNNLRFIDGTKEQLALEKHLKPGDFVSLDMVLPYIGNREWVLRCPGSGRYTLGAIGQQASCSDPDHSEARQSELAMVHARNAKVILSLIVLGTASLAIYCGLCIRAASRRSTEGC